MTKVKIMRWWNPKVLRYIGVILFLYIIFFKVGIVNLSEQLVTMDVWLLLLVFPLNWLQWWVRALRWRILLRNEDIDLPLLDIYVLGCASILIGVMTPGRLGEFIKVKYLMNAGHSLRAAFLSSFIERLLDLGTLMIFVAFAIIVCLPMLPEQYNTYLLIFVGGILGCTALFFLRKFIQKKFLGLLPERLAGSVDEKIGLFKQSLRIITTPQWLWLIGHSLLVWGLNYLMIFVLYTAAGGQISIIYAFSFAAIGSFAGLIPLSIFGTGIRESMLIVLFLMLGYNMDDAINESTLFGIMFLILLVYHILIAFTCWISPTIKPYLTPQSKPTEPTT
jgi:uncharacterized protein (TIRG00374 family)